MNEIWYSEIENNLKEKRDKSLYRVLPIIYKTTGRLITFDNKDFISFASNNYLDLANDRRIIEAGYKMAKEFGCGSGASRLISGTFKPLIDLENKFAQFAGKEQSLIFNSGYNANVGVISALADKNTVIFCDKLNHASIYDGIFLSGGIMERYPHKDIEYLKKLIVKNKVKKKKIIVTDTIFSMEGSIAPLKEIVKIAKDNDCLLIVDEAHSAGLFGENYSGIVTELNLNSEVDIIIGTLGKSFGVFGSYVASDSIMKDYFINNSRAFIFTTALPPFVIGALEESLNIIHNEKRGYEVLKKSNYLRKRLNQNGINTGSSESQIIPVIVGDNKKSLDLMNFLKERGIFAPAVRPPTVPPNTSRIRLSLSFAHTDEDIEKLASAIEEFMSTGK